MRRLPVCFYTARGATAIAVACHDIATSSKMRRFQDAAPPMKIWPTILVLFLFTTPCHGSVSRTSAIHQTYHANGISFSYPESWIVSVEQTAPSGNAFLSLIIESPGQSLVIIDAMYGKAATLRTFAEKFSATAFRAIQPGQPDGPAISTHFAKVSATQINEWFNFPTRTGRPMTFMREYHLIRAAGKTAFLIFQGSTEDLPDTRPGFRMIHDTLHLE